MKSKTFPEYEILASVRDSVRNTVQDVKVIFTVDQGVKNFVWEGVFDPLRICPMLHFICAQHIKSLKFT
jgi:hypothetical protein